MEILTPLIFIGVGLFTIICLYPKAKNSVLEMKYLKSKTISELKDIFNQMDSNGLGNEYREFVELKGNIVSDNLVETPFSNRKVAYYNSKVSQVEERREESYDSQGHRRTVTTKDENVISNEHSSQDIYVKDSSCNDEVVLEINSTGCELDIPKTFDRFESKSNVSKYGYFNNISYGPRTLGFKLTEETIEANQNLYVIGEAFKVGDKIHIGKPNDNKKPFIVSTKSEEDLVNSSNQKAMISLVSGIIAIAVGLIILVTRIIG